MSDGLERRFVYTMNRLLRSMQKAVSTATTPQEAMRLLNLYAQSQEYKDWCEKLATKITTQVKTKVDGTWREAAAKAGRGSKIYEQIQEDLQKPLGGVFWLKIKENASLIKTFPLSISQTLTPYIVREGLKGRRSTDILDDLMKKFPETAKSRLKLISRTEVSKTQTALTQARAAVMGLDWYIWRTSEDERVRGSHSKMNGVLVNWKDPPSPEALAGMKSEGKYHAGDIYNCRCYPEPVVNIDYVTFPAKVYYNGAIRTMSRKQFEKIA
ncbi:MAG: minor capsid protein [Eubacterium sp.]|nr:minor capsid protein [Eubacterium sp.]